MASVDPPQPAIAWRAPTEQPPPQPSAEFRASTRFALPALPPVPDFVGLPSGRRYVTVAAKFRFAVGGALVWLLFAVIGSVTLGGGFGIAWPVSLIVGVVGIAVPGAVFVFALVALLLDEPPPLAVVRPVAPVTVLLTAGSETGRDAGAGLLDTIASVATQDHPGALSVVLIDHGCSSAVVERAQHALMEGNVDHQTVNTDVESIALARDAGLQRVTSPLVVTVDAGVVLHPSAVRMLVARLATAPTETAVVSAHVLTRAVGDDPVIELVAVDAGLEAEIVTRLHALFQGALANHGGVALYRTDAVRAVNGWPEIAGAATSSDLVTTYRFLERGWRAYHETLALAFEASEIDMATPARRRIDHSRTLRVARRDAGGAKPWLAHGRAVTTLAVAMPVIDAMAVIWWGSSAVLLFVGQPWLLVTRLLFVAAPEVALAVVGHRQQRTAGDDAGMVLHRGYNPWLRVYAATGCRLVSGWCALRTLLTRVTRRRRVRASQPAEALPPPESLAFDEELVSPTGEGFGGPAFAGLVAERPIAGDGRELDDADFARLVRGQAENAPRERDGQVRREEEHSLGRV